MIKKYVGFQISGAEEVEVKKIRNLILRRGGSFNSYTLGGSLPQNYAEEISNVFKKDNIEYKIF